MERRICTLNDDVGDACEFPNSAFMEPRVSPAQPPAPLLTPATPSHLHGSWRRLQTEICEPLLMSCTSQGARYTQFWPRNRGEIWIRQGKQSRRSWHVSDGPTSAVCECCQAGQKEVLFRAFPTRGDTWHHVPITERIHFKHEELC